MNKVFSLELDNGLIIHINKNHHCDFDNNGVKILTENKIIIKEINKDNINKINYLT